MAEPYLLPLQKPGDVCYAASQMSCLIQGPGFIFHLRPNASASPDFTLDDLLESVSWRLRMDKQRLSRITAFSEISRPMLCPLPRVIPQPKVWIRFASASLPSAFHNLS